MGSSYFYLEFLLTWLSILRKSGYRNPAIFALEYSLVPDETFPTQVDQAMAGYSLVLSQVKDPSRVCLSGDSAGGTIMLSLMLAKGRSNGWGQHRPRLGAFFSPWVRLVSPENRDTESDFLNAESLHLYARQYTGKLWPSDDPVASPGDCQDEAWWQRSAPSEGFICLYGAEEVFTSEIRKWRQKVSAAACRCEMEEERNAVHAWPVVDLFLCDTPQQRCKGLQRMTQLVRERMPPLKAEDTKKRN